MEIFGESVLENMMAMCVLQCAIFCELVPALVHLLFDPCISDLEGTNFLRACQIQIARLQAWNKKRVGLDWMDNGFGHSITGKKNQMNSWSFLMKPTQFGVTGLAMFWWRLARRLQRWNGLNDDWLVNSKQAQLMGVLWYDDLCWTASAGFETCCATR